MGLDPISSRKVARAVTTFRQHIHAGESCEDHDGDGRRDRVGATLLGDGPPCRVGTDSGLFPAPLRCASILAHCGGRRESWLGFLPVVKFFLPHMPDMGLDLLAPSAIVLPPPGLTPE